MTLDFPTIIFVLVLIFTTQIIALTVQYRVNTTYRGIGWWLLGSILMVVGFIFMPMLTIKSLVILARIANPLVILGQISLYIGITRFLDMKENRWTLASLFSLYVLCYYYYMYAMQSVSGRTVVTSAAVAAIALMTAYKLFLNKDRFNSVSTNFTAAIFLVYGCFFIVNTSATIILPPILSDKEIAQIPVHIFAYVVPLITSTLWTFGFILMINQRLNSDNRLEKEILQEIFNANPDAALITRLSDGLCIDVNIGFSVMTGYSRDEVIGNPILVIGLLNNATDWQILLTALNDKVACEHMEFIFKRKEESQFIGLTSARIIPIHAVAHIIITVHDITDYKQTHKALIESEEKYRSIINASPDDITITDLEGYITMVSPAAKKIFGYQTDTDEYIGKQLIDFVIPDDIERVRSNIMLMYQSSNRGSNEYRAVRKDNNIFNVEVNSGFICDASGNPSKMIFLIRDITERKLAEQHIHDLIQQLEIEKNSARLNSITDSLTGIANRRYFDETLSAEFYRSKCSHYPLSVIMLDVDYFKEFNDIYGHIAGDDCLKQIGSMLKTIAGKTQTIVARYGGDEFILILPETEDNEAESLAKQIQEAVKDLDIPHSASDIAKYVTVSIGVTTIYMTELTSPKDLVLLADKSLYHAKRQGRNQIFVRNVFNEGEL